jgi:hypothetical protein
MKIDFSPLNAHADLSIRSNRPPLSNLTASEENPTSSATNSQHTNNYLKSKFSIGQQILRQRV